MWQKHIRSIRKCSSFLEICSNFVKLKLLVVQSCLTLCNPINCSLCGSSVHGILQARILALSCHSLLQEIFSTQGLNLSLLNCRQILYCLSYHFNSHLRNKGDFLIVQWSRIHLPMQGTQVWSLVWEDSTCHGATKPWVPQLLSTHFKASELDWAHITQLLKPPGLEPMLPNKGSHCD